jgi:hypothetical protein
MLDALLTTATWIGLTFLGTGFLLVLAMVISFVVTIFGADKENAIGFDFYKGDLDDD